MSINEVVPKTLGGLDEHSQPSAVEAALNTLVSITNLLDPLQKVLVVKAAAEHLRKLKLGNQEIVESAFARAPAGTPHPSQMWPAEEPWPDPVNIGMVLDQISAKIREHMVITEPQSDLIALWVAYTYVFNKFDVSPYLAVTSATKRCGKTTLMAIIERLVHRPLLASNTTPAVIYRSIDKWTPTLMLDEAETFLHGRDELRGILNSGHTRTAARVLRNVGDDHEPTPFSTWTPKAYALIGSLPSTLEDRSVIVRLRRKLSGESVMRLSSTALERFAEPIRRQLARWAADTKVSGELMPEPSSALNDRAADNWRPLLAIAEDAAADWLGRANLAALETLVEDTGDQDELTMLLHDLQGLFGKDIDFLTTQEVLENLHAMEERPWGDYRYGRAINAHQVAALLKSVDITPLKVRVGKTTPRGYQRSCFDRVFASYIREGSNQAEQVEQVEHRHGGDVEEPAA